MSDSAETVALGLLELLMQNEKLTSEIRERPPSVAKKILFNTYADCLRAVHTGVDRGADLLPGKKDDGAEGSWDPNAQGWSAVPDHKE